jgi:hypothetical protein
MDKIWHYTENGEYPALLEKYEKKRYPQIPCLVELRGKIYGVRFWNVTEECWDDEDCDDYYCEKESVKRWKYLDAIIEED